MSDELKKHLEGIDTRRREAIRNLIIGAAFAVPAVASFGLASANTEPVPGCFLSNQHGEGAERSAFGRSKNPHCGFVSNQDPS